MSFLNKRISRTAAPLAHSLQLVCLRLHVAEFQARRKAHASGSPVASKKQKVDGAEKTLESSQVGESAPPVPDSPARKNVPSAPKGFGELKDLLNGAAPVGSRRRGARAGN